ncbi:MAG: FHA domain-containing protein [Bacillota bacterium]|nr:FHA domain-containing protein [Bacillota bacterium]
MFDLISSILKYIFTLIIYLFIFGVIRLIYLDIKSMNFKKSENEGYPYLKLINQRENLDFKIEETYMLKNHISVGRGNNNDIVIKDPFVSGKHAEINVVDNNFVLRDLNSKNGTFLNGEILQEGFAYLKDGDKIKFGLIDFLFVDYKA